MPPLGILAGIGVGVFVIGGLLAALMKFQLDVQVLAAFFVLALVITGIAIAIKRAVGWIGIFPTLLFLGMLIFTAAYLA